MELVRTVQIFVQPVYLEMIGKLIKLILTLCKHIRTRNMRRFAMKWIKII